jgi:hypothetical protein
MSACGNSPHPQQPYDLTLHGSLAPLGPQGAVAVSTIHLHLIDVSAVSDRSSGDARAQVASLDLQPGASVDHDLPNAPPGLYSALALTFGDSVEPGLQLEAVWNMMPVHVMIYGGPYDVACAQPAPLQLGRRARLSLALDPSTWFSTVNLARTTVDPDDNGIVLSNDDNEEVASSLLINVVGSLKLDCAND